MEIKTFTYIEVHNLEHEWAVNLEDCKQEMNPIVPKYIFLHNEINTDAIYVDNMLTDTIPKKTIEGVTGGIADNYKEVGFWRIIIK